MFTGHRKHVAFAILVAVASIPASLLLALDVERKPIDGAEAPNPNAWIYHSTAPSLFAVTPDASMFVNPSQGIQAGVHAKNIRQFFALEEWLGASLDMVAVHLHWGNENEFPEDFFRFFSSTGKTVVVFWNPMDYVKPPTEQQAYHYSRILSGAWDTYIKEFVRQVASYEGDVIVAPFEEVNGDWVPWSGYTQEYGTVEEYKEAFRYLYKKFDGVRNVRFAWVVNNVSDPDIAGNQLEDYYPGDMYVDIIGVNGFNFGNPWRSFDSLFVDAIPRVQTYGKPIYITSFASAEGSHKAQWIEEFFNSQLLSRGIISGFLWFNENKERDWRISSDEASERVFKERLFDLELQETRPSANI